MNFLHAPLHDEDEKEMSDDAMTELDDTFDDEEDDEDVLLLI